MGKLGQQANQLIGCDGFSTVDSWDRSNPIGTDPWYTRELQINIEHLGTSHDFLF